MTASSHRPAAKNKAVKPRTVKARAPKAGAPKAGAATRRAKGLHPRNLHNQGYDFHALKKATPELADFVRPNPYGNDSIDFSDPQAVKCLNLALLRLHYGLNYWDIPKGFLCPPIPGRVDYLHYLADLLASDRPKGKGKPPKGAKISGLDIGTGANGIYPILGSQSYGWRFVGSDINRLALDNLQEIIANNPGLQGKLELRHQADPKQIFAGILTPDDRFDFTLCNPPFHASQAEAESGSQRKLKNLAVNRQAKGHHKQGVKGDKLNFGGQQPELWCEGGEQRFLLDMIAESALYASQVCWFTSLVSKKENLKPCNQALNRAGAQEVKVLEMNQGNKLTRVLAWSFLSQAQRQLWQQYRP
ncbi:23S rRNA (adenine(1618)-N(6))-methyltransferase RlmF [Shewanella sp. AS1]|uniref:23S rRNA (adenine(1618)-N(6))-methyltransferase RlmF n=1 Tax=Shewanella sp. AS1 TaxID=2907626 RepID=UPI001F2E5A8F|nr:23S rRNA (adenine(1618)-N(6))-methyltransferase RlmF [Shewanella sp. AS1]MCE9680542.1 23S rRNA (adenine(1618)-N(6))-methyltransferase RlmF [Shewanella sp. AS1]